MQEQPYSPRLWDDSRAFKAQTLEQPFSLISLPRSLVSPHLLRLMPPEIMQPRRLRKRLR